MKITAGYICIYEYLRKSVNQKVNILTKTKIDINLNRKSN